MKSARSLVVPSRMGGWPVASLARSSTALVGAEYSYQSRAEIAQLSCPSRLGRRSLLPCRHACYEGCPCSSHHSHWLFPSLHSTAGMGGEPLRLSALLTPATSATLS